ncbi:MAG: hypothetical protein GX051_00330 [Clostridiales bacterium]|nr:hypothetical protein [Clostridiales bacterium]
MPNLSLDTRDILAYPDHSRVFKDFCDTLENGFLPPKAEESPRTITESEQKMLDRIFVGITAKELSDAVKDAAQSPEMKELLKLSSYSRFIEE